MEEKKNTTTIDEYIANYSPEIQSVLKDLRKFINDCVPEAKEKISWGMPTFVLHGYNLVHFAVNKGYIGLYPSSTGVEAFKDELKDYKTTKGSIHLPLDKPMPYDLIKKIVEYRADENKRYEEEKKLKKSKKSSN
jgi:uncharacterized protein YdhG (YjbR/CyaY superfamily)